MTASPDPLHGPSLEAIERDAELLRRELDRAVELARSVARVVEESVSPSDAFDPLRASGAHELRRLRRAIARAHCQLVDASDARHEASRRLYEELLAADGDDAPWRDHRTEVAGIAA